MTKPGKKVSWTTWYRRLRHLCGTTMRKLNSSDTEQLNEKVFCQDFHLCKAKKLSKNIINEQKNRGIRKGMIHSDLMGLMKDKSMIGS